MFGILLDTTNLSGFVMHTVRNVLSSKVASTGGVATVIAAMLAAITYIILARDYAVKGNRFNLGQVFLPLFLVVCTKYFTVIVMTPLNYFTGLYSGLFNNVSEDSFLEHDAEYWGELRKGRGDTAWGDSVVERYNGRVQERRSKRNSVVSEEEYKTMLYSDRMSGIWSEENNAGFVGKLIQSVGAIRADNHDTRLMRNYERAQRGENPVSGVGGAVSDAVGSVGDAVSAGIETITAELGGLLIKGAGWLVDMGTWFLVKVVMIALQMYACIFMTVLGALGPLVFAFAVLPFFRGGIKLWFERYIEFSLWFPVLGLLSLCCSAVSGYTRELRRSWREEETWGPPWSPASSISS